MNDPDYPSDSELSELFHEKPSEESICQRQLDLEKLLPSSKFS